MSSRRRPAASVRAMVRSSRSYATSARSAGSSCRTFIAYRRACNKYDRGWMRTLLIYFVDALVRHLRPQRRQLLPHIHRVPPRLQGEEIEGSMPVMQGTIAVQGLWRSCATFARAPTDPAAS